MIATSRYRVPARTAPHVNEQIRRRTEANIAYFAAHRNEIDRRLLELDLEWDIERALETGSATLSLLGLTRWLLTGRARWLLLPLAVQSFFLQHALQGWCPPLPLLRRLGFRTPAEIERERYALRALRGDLRGLSGGEPPDVQQVLGVFERAGAR